MGLCFHDWRKSGLRRCGREHKHIDSPSVKTTSLIPFKCGTMTVLQGHISAQKRTQRKWVPS